MAHHHLNSNSNNNNRRTSIVAMPINNQIVNDSYDYELMKLMEQERQFMVAQQQLPRDNVLAKPQQAQYIPSMNEIYPNIQQPQAASQMNRRMLPVTSTTVPVQLPLVKPLRIVIIRHAERADAVLGSEWSKKSFDRSGRYIRFSEHLPETLPTRSYLHHYVIDVPLTNRGRMHAIQTGKALLFNGYAADICYTSPSLRCVQSADGILAGMGRKGVSMQLEPGLFECYLNDFKRTLCFMTKDELAGNGYNIDKSYQALMPFMRPHDSQLDYYARCQAIMNIITERHQVTGGTILIVAHAPSLEGLTRHFSGIKFQPEKLFDIARRVPFLAMTILEKNGMDSPWLFRTQPLQTSQVESMREVAPDLSSLSTAAATIGQNHSVIQHEGQQLQRHHQQHQQPSQVQTATTVYTQQNYPYQQQQQQKQQQQPRSQQTEQLRHGMPTGTAVMNTQQNQHQQPSRVQTAAVYTQQSQQQQQQQQQQHRLQQIENLRHGMPIGTSTVDPKKVVKSSTAPNLPTSNSLSEMFRVI